MIQGIERVARAIQLLKEQVIPQIKTISAI
jgi:hypothetical protein